MSSVLKAPWAPPPPKGFSPIPTHRHRNFCRIWESPGPTSQDVVLCNPQGSGVTQMDVDPKEISIATVLQNLSCGAPASTPPLHSDPLPSKNVNDQRSISPILGTNMTNLSIVSMSRPSPMILPQTFQSTPQLSPSPSSALPLSPLSEDHVPFFYASPPNHSHSPAHPQLTDTPFLTESVLETHASGDENNSTCMEDGSEDPFVQDTILAKKIPLHFAPSSLSKRCSATHNPVRTEWVNVLSPGPQQSAETTEVPISSKHAATRCRRKRTRPNYFEYESSEEEQLISKRNFSGETDGSRTQTHRLAHIGYLSNPDPQYTTSTRCEEVYGLNPQDAPNHSSNKANYYTRLTCKTIKREPSIIDLTEDVEPSDLDDLMGFDTKPQNIKAIDPNPASKSTTVTVTIDHGDHEPNHDVVKLKASAKHRTPLVKSKGKARSKSKSKPKSPEPEEKLPNIEHVVEGDTKYFCSVCNCTLNRSSDYRRHSLSNKHRDACNAPKITYECPFCQEILCRSDALKRHVAKSCRKRYSNTDTTFITIPTSTPS